MARIFKIDVLRTEVSTEIQARFPSTGTATALLNEAFGGPSGTSKVFAFDRGFTKRVKHRLLVAKFGDGYEQRVRDGINTQDATFNFSFKNRPWEEIEVLSAFLDIKAGLSFDAVISEETVKVVCENYDINYGQNDIHTLTGNFRKVYEP
jgi:phage-related protein